MKNEWKKGDPIPENYRNKMYGWEGGGYDGCIWEMNHGVVTDAGHWDPFHSTGRNGLDQDDWYKRKLREIKRNFGFSASDYHGGFGENVDAWFADRKFVAHDEAKKKFYGEDYHHNPKYFNPHAPDGEPKFPDVYGREVKAYAAELLKEDADRYERFCAARRDLDRERRELLDETFMDQVKAQAERDPKLHSWDYHGPARNRWSVYPLDEDRIRESCERFCREYAGSVGVMCGVLDALADRGYDVWCTCSDCGEQFQLCGYEKFSHLIDENDYHGDGGIGCVFTRVQCEQCHEDTMCPKCYCPNLPTRKDLEGGHAYDRWSFGERFVGIWLGVCDCCAHGFLTDDEHWGEAIDELETTVDNAREQLEKYLTVMRENGQTEENLGNLKAKNLKELTEHWRVLFNELRDRMQKDVEEYFGDCADWADRRIDTVAELKDYV